jgi:hypothetical protein
MPHHESIRWRETNQSLVLQSRALHVFRGGLQHRCSANDRPQIGLLIIQHPWYHTKSQMFHNASHQRH